MELNEDEKNFRVAIIGRSSSGKTTLIEELKNKGYKTVDETAREVLEERKNFNVTLEENLIRQKEIYFRQLERENKAQGQFFCDRGLIDILVYTEYFGLSNSFIDKRVLKNRYSLILELEKRPFILDNIRIEKDEKEADKIYQKVIEKYLDLGYSPISVPNFCEERKKNAKIRVDYIINILEGKNKI